MSYITLSNGGLFYLDKNNMGMSHISLEEIAHALSQINRFNGCAKTTYSVAQHSVMVSYLVPKKFAWGALMHDSPEAILGDITSPVKAMLPDYRKLEKRVEKYLMAKYRYSVTSEIKDADLRMLATERRDLMPQADHILYDEFVDHWPMLDYVEPVEEKIRPMMWYDAKKAFLERCQELDYGFGYYNDSYTRIDV